MLITHARIRRGRGQKLLSEIPQSNTPSVVVLGLTSQPTDIFPAFRIHVGVIDRSITVRRVVNFIVITRLVAWGGAKGFTRWGFGSRRGDFKDLPTTQGSPQIPRDWPLRHAGLVITYFSMFVTPLDYGIVERLAIHMCRLPCRSLAQYIRTRPTHHGISGGSFLALERVITLVTVGTGCVLTGLLLLVNWGDPG